MREKSDFVEVELKLLPDGRSNRVVELLREARPPGARLLQKPPSAYFDLYLDTAARDLDAVGASLRVRFGDKRWGKKARYRSNFKTGQPAEGDRWLSRREVVTDLGREEMLARDGAPLPGLAPTLARETIRAATGEERALEPVVVISTFRRYFTLRAPVPDEPDHMLAALEQSVALDARTVDVDALLASGVVDWSEPRRLFEFELAEVELTVEDNATAEETFDRLAQSLAAEFEFTTVTKYKLCLAELGLG